MHLDSELKYVSADQKACRFGTSGVNFRLYCETVVLWFVVHGGVFYFLLKHNYLYQ